MFKLSFKNLKANWGRYLLTAMAVILGASSAASAFIISDSLQSTFDDIFAEVYSDIDVVVTQDSDPNSYTFDESTYLEIEKVKEVDKAEPELSVADLITILDKEGKTINPTSPGAPFLTASWSEISTNSIIKSIEGKKPEKNQITLDAQLAKDSGYKVGEKVPLLLPDGSTKEYEVASIVELNISNAGSYVTYFDLKDLQKITNNKNKITSIEVTAKEGTSPEELKESLEKNLGDGLKFQTGEEQADSDSKDVGQITNIVRSVLLGFAAVIIFVSTFIIFLTFNIIVSQRNRQLALLKMLGASRKQIITMTLLEALFLGIISAGFAIVGGFVLTKLIIALINSFDGGFPDVDLVLEPRTIVVVLILSIFVTTISALLPSLNAARVKPLEAIRPKTRTTKKLVFRLVLAGIILFSGLLMMFLGLYQSSDANNVLTLVGFGSALTFIGTSLSSAFVAGPVTNAIGWPIEKLSGITGTLARRNASRNPRRTASATSALMIGVALITGVSVLSASLLKTIDSILDDSINAEIYIYTNSPNGIHPSIINTVLETEGVEYIASESYLTTPLTKDKNKINPGSNSDIYVTDLTSGIEVINFEYTEGSRFLEPSKESANYIAVSETYAEENNLKIGDPMYIQLPDGYETEIIIGGLYGNTTFTSGTNFILDRTFVSPHIEQDFFFSLSAKVGKGVDSQKVLDTLKTKLSKFTNVQVDSKEEAKKVAKEQINSLQAVVFAMLALGLLIAVIGIINSMALSIIERYREIGLLRAVGTTRRQLIKSIVWESLIISLFGSILGVGLGALLGIALTKAIPGDVITEITLPWVNMSIYIILGGLAGIVAAFFPAWRAARLNVIEATASE